MTVSSLLTSHQNLFAKAHRTFATRLAGFSRRLLHGFLAISLVAPNAAAVISPLNSVSVGLPPAPKVGFLATTVPPTDSPAELQTETPAPTSTAVGTSTPEATAEPSATPTPNAIDLGQAAIPAPAETAPSSPGILLVIEPDKTLVTPGDTVLVQWRIEGWDQLDQSAGLSLLFSVPQSFSPLAKEVEAFDAVSSTLRIPLTSAAGVLSWLVSQDAQAPFRIQAELFEGGELKVTSARILMEPTVQAAAASSGVPSISPIGWSGNVSGTFSFEWAGMSGSHHWLGPAGGGGWQATSAHTDFVFTNIPDGSIIEVCGRGNMPFKDWSNGGPRQEPAAVGGTYFGYFTLGTWTCSTVQPDLRYANGVISIGHAFGHEGRHQPGCCVDGPIPQAKYDWEVWVKSINGYEFAPPDGELLDRPTLADCDSENGVSDPRQCQIGACCGTQGMAGDPINTRTGGFSYSLGDLSVSTAAGPLVFQRTYSSLATDMYTAPIGYGWTHNQDTRLIFEGDPLGERGYVWFKAHSANQHRFVDNGDGTFTPYAGVLVRLTRSPGPPVTYTVTTPNQSAYTFAANGLLQSWADPQGRQFSYVYDGSNRLTQVVDPSGQRYLTLSYDGLGRISAVSDHAGRQVTYGYSVAGDLTTVTDVLSNSWSYEYDTSHLLTVITDPLGHTVLRVEYDAQGRAVRQFDGMNNKVTEVTYNPDGSATIEDARGNETTHVYDSRNTLVSEADPLGGMTTRSYDASFRLSSINNPASAISQFTWSSNGANLLSVLDPLANITSISYDALNNLTSVTDPRNNTTSFAYSGVRLSSSTDAQSNLTNYSYTPEGYLASVTDPLGHATSFSYDSFGQPTQMTDSLGNAWSYAHDSLGRLVQATDPLGRATRNEYDAAGRLTRETRNYDPGRPQNDLDQFNIVTQYAYDAVGNLLSVTDTLGRVTQYQYDAANRLTGITDPASNTTSFTYEAAGNLTTITDPLGNASTFTYDALNRQLTSRDPLLNITSYAYDSVGNLTSVTDASGIVTRYEYDALNRLTAVVGNYLAAALPDHQTNVRTEYGYDPVGSLTSARDARGNTTTYTFDTLNRLLTETDPLSNASTYGYDASGNLSSLLDAAGLSTLFGYDPANRLTTINYPAPDNDVTFGYDAAGNRTSMTDGLGTTNWAYDGLYRAASITDPFAATVAYGYDPLGNLESLTYPDSRVANYAYDAANRLVQVTDWDSDLTTYSYDAASRLTEASLPNAVTTSYGYDLAGRLLTLAHTMGAQTQSSFGYSYDNVGNRLAANENVRQPLAVSVPNGIFANGFESGTLGGWSSSSTGSGTLTVTSAAALAGTYGMQALINSTSNRYVQDTIPYSEARYRARFYFDPNSVTMANNNAHYLFYGFTGSSTVVLRVEFGFTTAGGYRLRVAALDNGSVWINSAWVNGSDASHVIELDWQSAANGRLDWWLDGAPQAGVSGFNNNNRRIDQVRLGTVAGLDSGTTGTEYFDAFESRRQSYIGSATPLPDSIFADDFESGGFGYWSASTGVSVTTAASLGPVGTRGMSVPLASATTAKYITDNVPGVEPRYRARFYFDPNLVTMANSADHVIFYGDSGTTPVLQVDLGYTTSGGYRLRARIRDNASLWNNSPWVNVTDAPHLIELDWQSGTSGSITWWIDETPQGPPANLNNSARRIDRVRLGAVANVDTTTNGTLYFDAFESRRQTYIGPMSGALVSKSITYAYDPLYRLTAADYSSGEFFDYTYDAVGNRLTQQTPLGSTAYTYDAADRLIDVNGVPYTWDAKGNLLSDGLRSFVYDHANRLSQVVQGVNTYTFSYNGLGDRLRQTVNGVPTAYSLDLNAGLTQVLSDGSSAFLYGLGRIGEEQTAGWRYHLPDVLASVRQLTDSTGAILLAHSFDPFGNTLSTSGAATSPYGFTAEWTDATALVHLRARYYDPVTGRFLSHDPFQGLLRIPASQHPFAYALGNPQLYTDPSGRVVWIPALLAIGATLGGLASTANYLTSTPKCNQSLQGALTAFGMGAVAGLVGTGATLLVAALLPSGLGVIVSGAIAGGVGGAASTMTWNVLTGQPIIAGVGIGTTLGVLSGGIAAGLTPVRPGPIPSLSWTGGWPLRGSYVGPKSLDTVIEEAVQDTIGAALALLFAKKPQPATGPSRSETEVAILTLRGAR